MEAVVGDVVECLDVDGVVRRIDVNDVVERVDINQHMERIDLDRLLDRMDLNRHLERIAIAKSCSVSMSSKSVYGPIWVPSSPNQHQGLSRRFSILFARK
jgi:hypothetical protein